MAQALKLRRPALLTRAARYMIRHASNTANAQRGGKLLGAVSSWGAARVLAALLETETTLNAQRITHDAAYSPSRHIEALAAVMVQADHALRAQAEARAESGAKAQTSVKNLAQPCAKTKPEAHKAPRPNVTRLHPTYGMQPDLVLQNVL
ncbi:MAG: DUF6477 family protein [Primorskyibacter sp.]